MPRPRAPPPTAAPSRASASATRASGCRRPPCTSPRSSSRPTSRCRWRSTGCRCRSPWAWRRPAPRRSTSPRGGSRGPLRSPTAGARHRRSASTRRRSQARARRRGSRRLAPARPPARRRIAAASPTRRSCRRRAAGPAPPAPGPRRQARRATWRSRWQAWSCPILACSLRRDREAAVWSAPVVEPRPQLELMPNGPEGRGRRRHPRASESGNLHSL
mmetsp:Transcript_94039/g.242950  ORF Transcript_94039/g.242950 Transcript_94039/m.242950 type:complete len:217 (+) Transcript_94039:326-976(+)